MVDLLISAGLIWGAVCIICFFAFMGIYLSFAIEQARARRAAPPPPQAVPRIDSIVAPLS